MRLAAFVTLAVLSLGVALYAVGAYGLLPLGTLVHPDMRAAFRAHPIGIYTHVFASVVALALGPFQFSSRLRASRIQLHRFSGRAYLGVGVLFGGLAGLYMSLHAFGGIASQLGFGCLALAWLFTGLRAFLAIRRHDVATHRRWMVRNFALTFAAVTLRLYLPASMAAGIAFELAYPVIAWLCWVPNVVVAEVLFNRTHDASSQPRAGGRPAPAAELNRQAPPTDRNF
ncbi:MAG: DUF2306 domain-containing protein [Burkholderiales bacterium]|nr:DUF2306 domain-containing protein [Burkholderiales bacterium]